MTVSDQLQSFRSRFPACAIVAFADLSTGMVLASNTVVRTGQETLDTLCHAGFDALMGQDAAAVSRDLSDSGLRGPQLVLKGDAAGLSCFLRARNPAVEALCLQLVSLERFDDLQSAAQDLLDELTQEH